MRKKIIWMVVSSLLVLTLLAAACGGEEAAPVTEKPAAEEEEVPAAVAEAGIPEVVASLAAEESKYLTRHYAEASFPAEDAEMVKVSWRNGEGELVEKMMEKPQYGGIARYAQATSVIAWDEAYVTPWGIRGYNHVLDGLIQGEWPRGPHCTNEVSWTVLGWMREDYSYGNLAESWEFPDDETAIFHIRQGVHWQLNPDSEASQLMGGRELDAHDIVFNIKRIYQDIKTSTMYGMAGEASRVVDVYAPDDWTVVLKSPPGQIGKTWEYVADWSYIFPPEIIEEYGDMNKWENVVGTGPFILTDYLAGSHLTYKRNDNYWMYDPLIPENRLPYLDGIKLLIIPDKSTEVSALRTGKIDWLHRQDIEVAEPIIKGEPGLNYIEYQPDVFWNLGFRLDKPELPFDDIRVRRALLMGINQREIVDTYFHGKGKVTLQTVMDLEMFQDVYTPIDQLPPSADGFDNKKMFQYHPDEAKQLLAAAGYPDGFKFTAVMTGYLPVSVDQMQMAQAYWDKIGVTLELDIKEAGAYTRIFQTKTHNEALLGGRWGGEPYSAFCVRKGNMWNWGMVDVPEFDAYYDEMTRLYFQPEERDKVMKELNLKVIDYAPYYMLPSGMQYTFWWPWVKNFDGIHSLGLGGTYFQNYMWIDQDLKKAMGR